MRVSECGRKIRNANRVQRRQDGVELAKREEGGREGRWEEDKEEARGGVGRGERGEGRGERGEGRGEERGEGRRGERGGEGRGEERGEGRRGERGGEGRRGGGVFDLKNQGLGFAPGRKKPCYRKSNSS